MCYFHHPHGRNGARCYYIHRERGSCWFIFGGAWPNLIRSFFLVGERRMLRTTFGDWLLWPPLAFGRQSSELCAMVGSHAWECSDASPACCNGTTGKTEKSNDLSVLFGYRISFVPFSPFPPFSTVVPLGLRALGHICIYIYIYILL